MGCRMNLEWRPRSRHDIARSCWGFHPRLRLGVFGERCWNGRWRCHTRQFTAPSLLPPQRVGLQQVQGWRLRALRAEGLILGDHSRQEPRKGAFENISTLNLNCWPRMLKLQATFLPDRTNPTYSTFVMSTYYDIDAILTDAQVSNVYRSHLSTAFLLLLRPFIVTRLLSLTQCVASH